MEGGAEGLRGPSPRRAPFAASRADADASAGSSRPAGSRYYTSGAAHADDGTTTPIWLTSLNIMNGVIGSGVVSLPYAIYQSGLPLGVFLCCLVAVVSSWTVRLLANLGQAHSSGTYEDLGHRAFGPVGFYAVCAFQGLFSFGAMCSYLVIFASLLPPALAAWTSWAQTAPSLLAREFVLAVPAVAILLPLCLYRAYGHLAKYSIIKALSISFLAATVLVRRGGGLGRCACEGAKDRFHAPSSHPPIHPAPACPPHDRRSSTISVTLALSAITTGSTATSTLASCPLWAP